VGAGGHLLPRILVELSTKSVPSKDLLNITKVENILKGSLNTILSPSPSVNIQIMGAKVCLRCKGKTLLGIF
jgi:hypothetical protein